jgi:endoglucanase
MMARRNGWAWFVMAVGLLASAATAQALEFKRGLNLDIWIEWFDIPDMINKPRFLDIYPEWRRSVSAAQLDAIAAAGFDFVRMPLEPAALLGVAPDKQKRMLNDVRATVEDLLDRKLNVIVDLHTIPRKETDLGVDGIISKAEIFTRYLDLVSAMGTVLQGLDPDRVAFELMNEPTHDCEAIEAGHSPLWAEQLIRLHAAARKATADLPLVLSGACWGGVGGLIALDPARVADDNVIWSFHSYEPFLATHQGAGWVGDDPAAWFADVPYPPGLIDDAMARDLVAAAEKRARLGNAKTYLKQLLRKSLTKAMERYRSDGERDMRDNFAKVTTWAKQHKIPTNRLLLGEFGAIRSFDQIKGMALESRTLLIADARQLADQHGIAWAIWSYGGAFGVTRDDQSRDFEPALLKALGLQ